VRGSQSQPARGISLASLTFKHTSPTYLQQYMAPSCGDWSIYPGGAVMLEGAEGAQLHGNSFQSLGGNAVFARGYVRYSNITRNR
jgi:hypothetical protein